MSYLSRAYDDPHGDPVVVLVARGTHDVSRLLQLLHRGNTEQLGLGGKALRQVRRHNGGRAALKLLRDHGGPDFTDNTPSELDMKTLRQAISDPGSFVQRGDEYREPIPAWSARAVVVAGWRP